MRNVNLQTHSQPQQPGDRLSAIQTAVYLDEVNHHAAVLYTQAGAITPGGKAFLRVGAPVVMTLAQPAPGPQAENGSDGATMKIIALDDFAYTLKTGPNGINGKADTVVFGGDAGDTITFDAFGGVWYVSAQDLAGVALTRGAVEVKAPAKPAAKGAPAGGKVAAPFGGFLRA